jgi:hypothetical protein
MPSSHPAGSASQGSGRCRNTVGSSQIAPAAKPSITAQNSAKHSPTTWRTVMIENGWWVEARSHEILQGKAGILA